MSDPAKPSTYSSDPSIFSPEPKERPDVLLTKFLQSTDSMNISKEQTPPQDMLKSILSDPRWTRRMLEDWFKRGAPSRSLSLTPDPEFRAIYLVLLGILEDSGRKKSGLGSMGQEGCEKHNVTKEGREEEEERKLKERIDAWKAEQGIEPSDEDWEVEGGEVGDRRMADKGRQ